MSYTPGPWKLLQVKSGSLRVMSGPKNIAETSQATRIEDAQEVLANAHLIALSPRMFEALKALIAIDFDTEDENYDALAPILDEANAIVAKAEGK